MYKALLAKKGVIPPVKSASDTTKEPGNPPTSSLLSETKQGDGPGGATATANSKPEKTASHQQAVPAFANKQDPTPAGTSNNSVPEKGQEAKSSNVDPNREEKRAETDVKIIYDKTEKHLESASMCKDSPPGSTAATDVTILQKRNVCRGFLRGNCAWTPCRFAHIQDTGSSSSSIEGTSGIAATATTTVATQPEAKTADSGTGTAVKAETIPAKPSPVRAAAASVTITVLATEGAVVQKERRFVCRNFLQGRCAWNPCRFSHIVRDTLPPAAAIQQGGGDSTSQPPPASATTADLSGSVKSEGGSADANVASSVGASGQ
jgi:hypothetical protein